MAKAVRKVQWDYVAEIWVILANAYRDEKVKSEPYQRHDVHPLRSREDYGLPPESAEPDWDVIAQIKRQFKVSSLRGQPECNSSG